MKSFCNTITYNTVFGNIHLKPSESKLGTVYIINIHFGSVPQEFEACNKLLVTYIFHVEQVLRFYFYVKQVTVVLT